MSKIKFPKILSSAHTYIPFKKNFRLPYEGLFGGTVAITKTQFQTLNGYSNKFLNWGGEDDEMYDRVKRKFGKPIRVNKTIGRYSMVKHKRSKINKYKSVNYKKRKLRFIILDYINMHNNTINNVCFSKTLLRKIIKQKGRMPDGLDTLSYSVKSVIPKRLYTWYLVEV